MPRFFFHTEDGELLIDRDGTELAGLDAAKDTAVQIMAESLHGNSRLFWENEGFRVTVTDAQDLTLFSLQVSATFAAAMAPSHRKR
jgi:hypothetical protein